MYYYSYLEGAQIKLHMYSFRCSSLLYNNSNSTLCLSISDALITVEEMASREVTNYLTVNNMSPSYIILC